MKEIRVGCVSLLLIGLIQQFQDDLQKNTVNRTHQINVGIFRLHHMIYEIW